MRFPLFTLKESGQQLPALPRVFMPLPGKHAHSQWVCGLTVEIHISGRFITGRPSGKQCFRRLLLSDVNSLIWSMIGTVVVGFG